MIKVNIQGHGSYVIQPEKLSELIAWLTKNSMPVESSNNPYKDGDSLLNG